MKIIYFTTAVYEKDYGKVLSFFPKGLNTSNQNFHFRMISAFSLSHEVEIFSFPYFANGLALKSELKQTRQNWHYLFAKKNKISRLLSYLKQSEKLLKEIQGEKILVTDSMNITLLMLVSRLGKKFHLPFINLATDSPYNISFTNRFYTQQILKYSALSSGVIALTDELEKIFNIQKAPSLVIPGVLPGKKECGKENLANVPYFFFAGAMMRRYGLYQLIEAFKQLDHGNIHLLLAGHHYNQEELNEAIKDDLNIIFLGTLPYGEIEKYEAHSLANINPRPYDERLDHFSVPSKTLEYADSPSLTISTDSGELSEDLNEGVLWIKDASVESLKAAMEEVMKMTKEERTSRIKKANQKAEALCGASAINQKLDAFLPSVK